MFVPLASIAGTSERLVRSAGYPGLAGLMVVENLFPPIPSEVILPLAGYQVSQGQLTFVLVLIAATAGSLIGAWIIYAIGRIGGRPVVLRLHPLLRIKPQDLDRAERWFSDRGDRIVLLGRLVPGVRSLVSAPAGMLHMPLLRFSLLTGLGSLVWNGALIGGGLALGDHWRSIAGTLGPVSTALGVLLVLGLALSVFIWRKRRPAVSGDA